MGAALAHGKPHDLDSAGLEGDIWRYRGEGGVDLAVHDVTGHGAGVPLIMLHDWGDSPISLLDRASEAVQHHRRVILPTMRGHEDSGGACSLGPSEVHDLGCLLDVLQLQSVMISGHGLGGHIADAWKDDLRVESIHSEDAWENRSDGLRRILSQQGIPAFPIAITASWIWPESSPSKNKREECT